MAALVGSAPALAQGDNIVCDDGDETELGGLIATIMTLVVTIAALVAVLGGAGFTLASAARPTKDYQEKRNKAIGYGAGTLVILYGANTIITQFAEELDFGCVLPFLD